MGFFSSLVSSPKVKTPASGFYSQPDAYQGLYNNVLGNINTGLPNVNTGAFTPPPLNTGEQNALGNIYQGFTPDAQGLQSDIAMQQNPFDEYVINGINREATGQNSLVNQAATQAGQQGSNRSFLGTSDVEQNRLNNIGQFKQSQYNNAVQNSLGALTNSRRSDATGALGAGTYERDLTMQTQLAPLQAMMAQLGLLQGVPTSFGNFGNEASSSGGGLDAGKALSTAGTIAGFFSDERLKDEDTLEKVGEENGIPIYEFTYIGGSQRYRGTIAQEVLKIRPEAVTIDPSGFFRVNYDMLGIEMRAI